MSARVETDAPVPRPDSRHFCAAFPLRSPAYNVVRIAGGHIHDRAARWFSGRLLDIGCGSGAKAVLVADSVDQYVGLDREDCPHGRSTIDLFGSAYSIPSEPASFDCVLSTAVLEHLEDPCAALREAYRVLRPGGIALYTAPLFWYVHEPPRDFYRYTEFGLRNLFGRAGFELMEVAPLSGFWIALGAQPREGVVHR